MDGRTTPPAPAPTARPQPTTQRPREYMTHVPRLCPPRVSLAPARKDGRVGARETVGQRRRRHYHHCAGGVASPVKRSAKGEFSHQSADDGGAVEDINRAIDPHLTSN